jgi:hypothetical protein
MTIPMGRTGLLLAMAPLLAACSAHGTSNSAEGVSLLVFGEPEELAAYRGLVAAYAETQGGSEVQLIEASDRDDLLAPVGYLTASFVFAIGLRWVYAHLRRWNPPRRVWSPWLVPLTLVVLLIARS